MPLATLTYIPGYHDDNTTARRASFSTALSWRKLLPSSSTAARKKYDRCLSSPTALAGAAEKFIRHHPPKISCEDLTAREFAMLAGISTTINAGALDEDDLSSTKSEGDLMSPKIWDRGFWLQPSTSTTTTESCSMTNDDDDDDLRTSHPTHRNSAPNIILRGRFQICVGEDNTNSDKPMFSSAPHVFEWKRKKSV